MLLWFYSLLMRQERGVSGCVHWCDRPGVCWMRVNACGVSLGHLPITRTCRVITESWPWRSGPSKEPCIHGALKAATQHWSDTPNSYPSSLPLYVHPKPTRIPWFHPPSGMGLRLHVARGDVATVGQRCLLEVRFRQWAHLIAPSGRVTWHN